MQHHEVKGKSNDVSSSQPQDSSQQKGTERTDWYRPKASQSEHDQAKSQQLGSIRRVQGLFEPGGADRFLQSSRPPERRNPPVTDSRSEEQKQADKAENLRRANKMFNRRD